MNCPHCGSEMERAKVQDEGRTLEAYYQCPGCTHYETCGCAEDGEQEDEGGLYHSSENWARFHKTGHFFPCVRKVVA